MFLEEQIGKKIYELRVSKAVTQTELAEALLVCQRDISRWENGKVLVSTAKLFELCKFFDVSLAYFDTKDYTVGRKLLV